MTRKQRPRGATTREDVVNAALAVADRDGLDALTIRSVAEKVGAPPMSLYSHFSSKDDLLDLMYADVARRMYEDEGNPGWQEELLALCHRVRQILKGHPNWAPLLTRPALPLSVPLRERVLKLMVADGLPEDEAFRALATAVLVAQGLALVELTLRGPSGESTLQRRFERLKEWYATQPNQGDSLSRRAISRVGPGQLLDDMFSSAVGALIRGFEAIRVPASDSKRDTR